MQVNVAFIWKQNSGTKKFLLVERKRITTSVGEVLKLFRDGSKILGDEVFDLAGHPSVGDELQDYSWHDMQGWSVVNKDYRTSKHLSIVTIKPKEDDGPQP